MFKVNNKDTRTTPIAGQRCLTGIMDWQVLFDRVSEPCFSMLRNTREKTKFSADTEVY